MGFLTEPTHLIIIAIILLVLFGGKKLPELGKGLGEGLKGFKEGLKGINDPSPVAPTVQQSTVSAPTAAARTARSGDWCIASDTSANPPTEVRALMISSPSSRRRATEIVVASWQWRKSAGL